jgi:hypothetical protein
VGASLQHRQQAMQRTIMSDGATVAASDDAERLSIYATAYRLRLREALAHNYPALQTQLGVLAFTRLADGYRDAHPSTHGSVRAFGAHLPEWLNAHRSAEPWLAEFARFEWALANAFDALDGPSVGIEALARIEPTQWAQLTFCFSPSVERLTLRTNAAELYARAADQEIASEAAMLDAPSDWLIWRQSLTAQYRSMSKIESCAFDALLAGQTFGDACELMFEMGEAASVPMQAAAFLKRWVADELISSVAIGD